MKNTILIRWNELQQQIDLRNYYMGESAKRKDIDADTIQSSKDEKELFALFFEKQYPDADLKKHATLFFYPFVSRAKQVFS